MLHQFWYVIVLSIEMENGSSKYHCGLSNIDFKSVI